MAQSPPGAPSAFMEAVLGFSLGAIAGCSLGATEGPVEEALGALTAAAPLQPLLDDVSSVGALGLGTLMAATGITVAMTSVVAGVILAAAVASLLVSSRSCGGPSTEAGLWASAGLAGALGATLSGATLGATVEGIVRSVGLLGLLGALSVFTVLKPPLNLLLRLLWRRGEACCSGASGWARQREQLHLRELQQRHRAALHIQQEILLLEGAGGAGGAGGGGGGGGQAAWLAERRLREETQRRKEQSEEARAQQENLQDWISTALVKHVDVLAFSGIPMTVVAMVASGFGVLGYGNHQFALAAVLILVASSASLLLKPSRLRFWMLFGTMATLATFIIAVLTLHAGQLVVTDAVRAGPPRRSREGLSARVAQRSCLAALSDTFCAARLCQLCLGATLGGPLARLAPGGVGVVVGAALVAVGLLGGITLLSPVLGQGGQAGALLGAVGAAGVCVGAAAARCGRGSSWPGALGTVAGLVVGAVRAGRLHLLNVGLQLPAAYLFAMTNPF